MPSPAVLLLFGPLYIDDPVVSAGRLIEVGNESRVTALMQPGSGVGSYVVESLVAKRSEGIVLRARHPSLRRSVTLELIGPPISSAPGYRERFLSAWRIAASLDHPGIITVYDAGEHHGHLFAATDEGPGVDLAALVAAHGPLAPARAARLIAAAAGALDAAYAHGLVHSGLKMQHLAIVTDTAMTSTFVSQGSTPMEGGTSN